MRGTEVVDAADEVHADVKGFNLTGEGAPAPDEEGETEVAADDDAAIAALRNPEFDYHMTVLVETPVPTGGGDPSEAVVEIVDYDGTTGGLVIRVSAPSAGVLVLSEPYYSERRASVDGQEVPLLRANIGFCAVALPAGSHEVLITYAPDSLYLGAAITGATILLSLAIVVFSVTRRVGYLPER